MFNKRFTWKKTSLICISIPAIFLLLATQIAFTQPITAIPSHADGIYKTGEKISWQIAVTGEYSSVHAVVKENDAKVLWEGTVKLTNRKATLETSLDKPGMILTSLSLKPKDKKSRLLLGAAIEPFKIPVSAPRPADFDSFWNSKIRKLKAIPANPVLTAADSGTPDVEYSKITMDNINASHVYGQIAKPNKEGKFPAILIVQWAGVYGLPKRNVINPAKQGWLTLNIMAHDLPFDKPAEFYKTANSTTHKHYTSIGNDSRETSYFLRMFLGCYRAADYLTEHPDWDGKTLVVTGTSQGGMQGFATAGLHPSITGMLVNVPAGCDTTGPWIGRSVAWPNWKYSTQGKDEKNVMETSRYFDAVNFAYNIHCPALVAIGMLDQTATPAGILAAFNQIKGPKEAVLMINSPHQNKNNSQAPWRERSSIWFNTLLKGEPAPVNK
ncbi:MAG: acetylxylan esterase [Kiritimatiellae bacterium]|jgi:cephalosporin-C deacetylase|nr:acetylxylan esterase [Kiritimatiellia bacterium]